MAEKKTPKTPPVPRGLSPAGLALWRSIVPAYELRPDELRVLHDACREADVVARLAEALEDAELLVTGSQGQKVINPLVQEVRQHRTVLAALLRQLKLPDTPSGARQKQDLVSEQARAAARARWGTRSTG
jgi:hypothetical protein